MFIEDLDKLIKNYIEDEHLYQDGLEGKKLIDDLGFDSVSIIQLMSDIEEHFNIEFKDEDILIESFETYEKLKSLVEKMLEA